MKKMKRWIVALLLIACFMVSLGILSLEAKQDTQIEVSYSPNEDELMDFYLEISIKGEGSVYDHGMMVQDRTVFQLHYEDNKKFLLKPRKGYEIANVIYDNEDITSFVKHDEISIMCKDHDTILEIIFQKTNVQDGTNTGDHSSQSYFVIFILSSISIAALCFWKHHCKGEKVHDT